MATLIHLKGVRMMNVIYDIKDEAVFDDMMAKLGEMTGQEEQHFMLLLQGYQAGVRVGQRIAEGRHGETA